MRDVGRKCLRWLRRLAITMLVIEGAYLAIANVALASGVLEDLISSGASVKVGYRRAWSLWPGFVHIDDVRVVMQDRNVQFGLDIPSVDVRLRMWDVLHRTFHATRVRGEGVVFRFRQRIEPDAAGRPFVRALPSIPGFADPPLRDRGPPPPPIEEAHYDLWTVHIEDVDVAVREIWIDMFRYQGAARAKGAFRLRPARRVWVGPATLRVESGGITAGPHDAMHAVEGDIGCRVEDFDVQAVKGVDVFRYISSHVRLVGQTSSLEAVNYLLPPSSGLSFEDGSGLVDADVAIDRGVFTPGTRFSFRMRRIGVAWEDIRAHLDGDLLITANRSSADREGGVTVHIAQAVLQLRGSRYPPVRLSDVAASATTTSVDLSRHWSLGESDLRIGEVAFTDLRWLNDLPTGRLPPWIVEGGTGTVGGIVKLSRDRALQGWGAIHVLRAGARTGDLRIEASVDADAIFAASLQHPLSGDIHVDVRDVRASRIGSGVCPWAKVDSASMTGRITRGEDRPAIRELRATLRGSSVRWGEFEAFADRSTFEGRWNPGWMQGRLESTGLRMKNAGGSPRSWDAGVEAVSINTVLTSSQGQTGGNVRIETRQVNGQVGKTKMGGDVVAQLAIVSPAAARTADVSGVILVHNVKMSKGENRIDGWWAQLNLNHANIDTSLNFDLTASGQARVQNGLPVLYLLSSDDESPNWLVSQLARHTLVVDIDVHRFCRWTDVQIPLIEGGLLSAQGRVQAEPGQTYGAMLFRLAPLKMISVGVAFYEDYSGTSLLVGSGWLEQQMLPMSRAATIKHDLGCPPAPPRCE